MKTKEIRQEKNQEKIESLLSSKGLPYIPITYYGCEGFFLPINGNGNSAPSPGVVVTTCGKEICRVYPHEIMYIAIEGRKSVMYLTDRKLETYHSIDHWKAVLDKKSFAQPHYSYIVNLNYVSEVTKEFVILRCGKQEHKVYSSIRKIAAFKRAVAEYGK